MKLSVESSLNSNAQAMKVNFFIKLCESRINRYDAKVKCTFCIVGYYREKRLKPSDTVFSPLALFLIYLNCRGSFPVISFAPITIAVFAKVTL